MNGLPVAHRQSLPMPKCSRPCRQRQRQMRPNAAAAVAWKNRMASSPVRQRVPPAVARQCKANSNSSWAAMAPRSSPNIKSTKVKNNSSRKRDTIRPKKLVKGWTAIKAPSPQPTTTNESTVSPPILTIRALTFPPFCSH